MKIMLLLFVLKDPLAAEGSIILGLGIFLILLLLLVGLSGKRRK